MENIGMIYEITGNPYITLGEGVYKSRISEYPYPSEINSILKALKLNGYNYELVDGPFDLLKRHNYLKSKCSIFFNKSIGFKGLERKIPVPALALMFELPIIGSSAYSMTLARHKYHTNRILAGMGFRVPWAYLVKSTEEIPITMPFPVIVKPNEESDSLGIDENSICLSGKEVFLKVDELLKTFDQPIIIEEFIGGDELKVPVAGYSLSTHALGCVKVLKNSVSIAGSLQTREDILNKTIKYSDVSENDIKREAMEVSVRIHQKLDLYDYSRCDFRLNTNNELYCMEVSTHPYIGRDDSSFIEAALQSFSTYEEIIKEIVSAGKFRLKV